MSSPKVALIKDYGCGMGSFTTEPAPPELDHSHTETAESPAPEPKAEDSSPR